MALGYESGNPFGDPSKFSRSTGGDEIDRYNQWMRGQDWYTQARGDTQGDLNDDQRRNLETAMQQHGISMPGAFHIDEGGNLNQKSRTKRNLIIAGLIGAGVLTGGAALGAFGGAGAVGAGGGLAAGGTAAGTGGALGATSLATGSAALGGGLGLGGATAAGGLATGAVTAGGASGIAGGFLAPSVASSVLPAASTAAKGGGFLKGAKGMGQRFLDKPESVEAATRGLAGGAQAQASNRGTAAELALDSNAALEDQLLAREREKRNAQNQAYTNMMLGDRATSWKPLARPTGISGSYEGMTPRAQASGDMLFQQALARMKAPDLANGQGGMQPYRPVNAVEQYGKPGIGEKAMGYGAAALPLLGLLNRGNK